MNDCVHCIYCPDMNIKDEAEWTYSDDGTYKIRKPHKEFRCLYDSHVIKDWSEPCPLKKE